VEVTEDVPTVAVIVELVFDETAVVAIANVAEEAPAATVTDAGRVALELLDFRLTTAPPAGAAAERLTCPVLDEPPISVLGLRATELSVTTTGLTVREAE